MLIALLVVHLLVTLLATGHIVLQDKRPSVQLAWIFGIAAVPVIGIGGYMLIGSDRLLLRRERRRDAFQPKVEGDFQPHAVLAPEDLPERHAQTLSALARLSRLPTTPGNSVEVLADAEAFYPRLEEAIAAARKQLWLCFYVWRDDEIGRDFVRQVAAAAARGVEVRVLVDEVGSGTTPESLFDELVAAGGRFSWAMTLFPRRNRWFLNLRNHRKIVMVDGELAFIGGMNLGREYVDGVDGSHWNDLQLALRGPVVTQLAAVFADDWHFATNETLRLCHHPDPGEDGMTAQLIAGGPDHVTETNARSIEALVSAARERVVLTTPYFVPDQGLLAALEVAAARGVRVRLLVSAETDMGPMLLLSRSYFDRLLAAGIEISEYAAGIHHAKLMLVDDDLAMVGSINLDVRSFHLNYEIAVVLHDREVVAELDGYLARRTAGCAVLDRVTFGRRPVTERLREGFLRLLSPLL